MSKKGAISYADEYLHLGYEPKDDELLCAFKVTPRDDIPLDEAAAAVAAESSTGTWTDVDSEVAERLKARVYKIDGNMVYVSYQQGLFEISSMPNILSSVAGNVFGMKAVEGLRLEDIRFPKNIVNAFPGPKYGLPGVRERMGIQGRAMTGSTIKPKIGLTTEEHAQVCYETWMGGTDTVKDDENLGSQDFNNFYDRMARTLELLHKAEAETGEKKGYWANLTAATVGEMAKRAESIKEHGGIFVMVDYVTVGYTGVASLREITDKLGLVIHAHRAMHAAFDRVPYHGIEYRVIAKTARLLGVDHLHTGTGVGKLEGGPDDMRERIALLRDKVTKPFRGVLFEQDWQDIKPVAPVASGGLHPGHVPALHNIFGIDAYYAFGGGIHGHPGGSRAGGRAVRAAVEAAAAGVTLEQAAKDSPELRAALNLWSEVKF